MERNRPIFLLSVVIGSLAVLAVFQFFDRPSKELAEYRVERFRIVESWANEPPIDADWQSATSKNRFPVPIRRENFNSSWIAIAPPFEADAREQMAIYIPSAFANIDVYLGDTLVGSGGPMERPLPYYRLPLYFELPQTAGGTTNWDTLYVRTAREARSYMPPPIYIGPAEILLEKSNVSTWLRLWLPLGLVILMIGIAASLAMLYVPLKKVSSFYGIASAIVALWGVHSLHFLVQKLPIAHWTWFAIAYIAMWWVILAPILVTRLFDMRKPRLERGIVYTGIVLMSPIFGLLATWNIEALYRYYFFGWLPFVLSCSTLSLYFSIVALWREWTVERQVYCAFTCFVYIVGFRDFLFDWFEWVPGTTFYLQYIGLFYAVLVNGVVAHRYLKTTRDLAALNQNLDSRVQEKSQEIEKGFRERRELERQNTLAQERNRLMRDMHDGLGGQLIQALALSEKGDSSAELQESIEQALIDLRLIVDSIAPEENDLVSLLASFRHRTARIWKRNGVDFVWSVADVPTTSVSPERSLNIIRILQEATTNAFRHGHATRIEIVARVSNGKTCVEVIDDGCGFDDSSVSEGYGLTSMKQRALEANVELEIASGPGGTCVRFCIPDGSASQPSN